MLKNELFKSRPDFGQLAVDGEWEKAVVFASGAFHDLAEAQEYIGNRSEVAFEAFFKGAFFGMRRKGIPEKLSQFIVAYAHAMASSKTGAQFFEEIAKSQNLALAQNFSVAEIGAVNAWRSVGPFVIKDPFACLQSFEDVWSKLQSAPVSKNTTHSKALEFAFNNGDGTTHWFALPISSDTQPFSIERDKLKMALSSYLHCSQ